MLQNMTEWARIGMDAAARGLPTMEHPQGLLPQETVDELRMTEGLVIAEIAGRDSIAAALTAVRDREFSTVVPTAAYTCTQFGDWTGPARAVESLKERLPRGVRMLDDLVWVGSPALWAALNGRYAAVIRDRLGLFSPCLACHLYMHLCRLPLSWHLGRPPVIAGDRDSHDGRLKLSQLPDGIDACIRVMRHGKVELIEPVRGLGGAEIGAIVGSDWRQGGGQLQCVLSGNYAGLEGDTEAGQAAFSHYAELFLEPVGRAIVDGLDDTHEPDYDAIVRERVTSLALR